MTYGSPQSAQASPQTRMTKVVIASISGALLEWYDFFLYGIASALVFGTIFFPNEDPATAIIASFATFGAGFLARPVGGLVFGHMGDRVGRKVALMWTLVIVGSATVLIGFIPTYTQIGVWAPILLVVLRLIQGFGLGGEYGGAALLTIEHAPEGRKGFFGSLPQMAASAGILTATGAFALCEWLLTDEQMLSFGWRIPFWVSALMLIVGIFVRSHTEEPPEFLEAKKKRELQPGPKPPSPLVMAFRTYPKQMFLSFGARLGETVSSNIINAFGIAYIATQLGMSRQVPLDGMLLASAIGIAACPIIGRISDKVGLRTIYLIGAGAVIAMAFPFFGLLNTKSVALIWVALIVAYNLGPTMMFAVQPTLFTTMFGANVRYTGLSFAYQFSAIVGGLTPMICAWLVVRGNGAPWGVALYWSCIGIISFVCTLLIKPQDLTAVVKSQIDQKELAND